MKFFTIPDDILRLLFSFLGERELGKMEIVFPANQSYTNCLKGVKLTSFHYYEAYLLRNLKHIPSVRALLIPLNMLEFLNHDILVLVEEISFEQEMSWAPKVANIQLLTSCLNKYPNIKYLNLISCEIRNNNWTNPYLIHITHLRCYDSTDYLERQRPINYYCFPNLEELFLSRINVFVVGLCGTFTQIKRLHVEGVFYEHIELDELKGKFSKLLAGCAVEVGWTGDEITEQKCTNRKLVDLGFHFTPEPKFKLYYAFVI